MAELAAQAARAEELGFDSVWVMDHFFVEWQGRRVYSHDPLLQLAAMAAATRGVTLGPLVLASPFREPAQLAREAATLQDMSGGRLILGLGSGWYAPEFEAAGIPFDHLVGRFERSLQRLVPMLPAAAAGSAPPIWIAAAGPRMLGLAARWAQGWNLAWGGRDPAWYADAVGRLRGALAAAGRPASAVTRSVGISVLPLPDREAEAALERARRFARGPRDLDFVQGGPAVVAAAIKAYAQAGAQHVILNLSSSPLAPSDPGYLERAAEALALVR